MTKEQRRQKQQDPGQRRGIAIEIGTKKGHRNRTTWTELTETGKEGQDNRESETTGTRTTYIKIKETGTKTRK
jgi:hypothetical protein